MRAAAALVRVKVAVLDKLCSCSLQWQPTREGYLRFLTESKAVYEMLERIVVEASHPECARPPPKVSKCKYCRNACCLLH